MAEILHQIPPSWQKSLHELITEPKQLFEYLQLDPALLPAAEAVTKIFPLRISRHYLQQIQIGNIHDPLLKQILPLGIELETMEGFQADPLGEQHANPVPGLLHKYPSRVLLTVTQACAIHCRYCFRREFDYDANNPGRKGWPAIISHIQNHPEVNEVIYSGGDPLMASDDYLAQLTGELSRLPQLSRLRIHSRLPLLIPERLTPSFFDWFCKYPDLKPIFILHCNHPQEISIEVKNALGRLKQHGVTLLNQSVLLKGINDDAATLIQLSETLLDAGVLPYYLHLLDRVQGTAHFEVHETVASDLMRQIQIRLPGFLVPKLVREVAGAKSKLTIPL